VRLETSDFNQGYVDVCRHVLEEGREVSPRGQKTREVLDAVIVLSQPHRALPIGTSRGLKPAIAVAEALQLIGEVSYPQLLGKITKNFTGFMDGGTFHAAYGPRLRGQVDAVIDKINEDADTRQAVMTIWDPQHDNAPGYADYPCTIALQFMVRDRALDLHVTMRSNDVWLGLPYDIFQFTQLQIAVANTLGVPAGVYYHHVVSLHAYERDWDKIVDLELMDGGLTDVFYEGVLSGGFWDVTRGRARTILAGRGLFAGPSATEKWMAAVLEPYL
jgi:thymidylate synthase